MAKVSQFVLLTNGTSCGDYTNRIDIQMHMHVSPVAGITAGQLAIVCADRVCWSGQFTTIAGCLMTQFFASGVPMALPAEANQRLAGYLRRERRTRLSMQKLHIMRSTVSERTNNAAGYRWQLVSKSLQLRKQTGHLLMDVAQHFNVLPQISVFSWIRGART